MVNAVLRYLAVSVLFSAQVWASDSLYVRMVADEQGYVAQVAARLESLIKRADSDIQLGEPERSSDRRLLVALGNRGWRAVENNSDGFCLAVLPPKSALEGGVPGGRVSVVQSEMPLSRTMNFIQLLMQKRGGAVALLAGPQTQARLNRIEALASDRGVKLSVEKVERESDVGMAVERVIQQATLLLALPDAIAHNANTVPPLLLTAYRSGVPVVGYSEAYLKAGAVAAIYATPDQLAQQVLELILAYKAARPLPGQIPIKYYSVGYNTSVARSLGLSFPSSEEVEARLKQMRE